MSEELMKDGGWNSRKMIMTYVAMGLIALGGGSVYWIAALAPLYDTFVGGVLGALGLYLTGNAATKLITGKAATALKAVTAKSTKASSD